MPFRKCNQCGKRYEHVAKWSKYCSRKCTRRHAYADPIMGDRIRTYSREYMRKRYATKEGKEAAKKSTEKYRLRCLAENPQKLRARELTNRHRVIAKAKQPFEIRATMCEDGIP